MAQRMFTTLLIALTVVTVAMGCARSSTRARSTTTEPAASPTTTPRDLVGTWRGTAWEVGGDLSSARTDAVVQIHDNATWSAQWTTNHGAQKTASGTLTTRGDRVMLRNAAGGTATLKHRGDQLYGLLESAVADLNVQVDLKKVQ